ncbi:hypothetical protein [Bacillus cereus group sp. RP43]|uniref:hypothetical protein n=1 Tax=Bacillus cereus group sp. RP43 TaxID=3040260 RepID=UPI003399B0EF
MRKFSIEEIYQEILEGKRTRFPAGTWSEDQDKEAAERVTRYLIEEVLNWNAEDLKKGWNQKLIIDNKLAGVLSLVFNGSPYAMLNQVYPNKFKEWEFKSTPMNFWTEEKGLEALEWTIEEKETLTSEQIIRTYGYQWLLKNKLETPCSLFFNGSPYLMLNTLYPNRFKEWEFKSTPNKFWTIEKSLDALKWTIEVKEKLTDNQILEVYNLTWIRKNNLSSPCQIYWSNHPYAMLNNLYPNRFKEWQLKNTRHHFWTKEKALMALKWTIEDKEKLDSEEIKKLFSFKWLCQQGLRTPVMRFWKSSPYAMLNELYPNCFKEWELRSTPNKFWTEKKAIEALKWTVEEKENLTVEELKGVCNKNWLTKQKLRTPFDRYWNSNIKEMLNELSPK